MECGFGIYCTIFADTPVCMGQKSTKSQGGTRYLWKKRRGSIKISVLVHQKLLPPEPTSVFRTHFGIFHNVFPCCSQCSVQGNSMGSLRFLQPMRNGPMRPSMGYWASPTQDLFAQTHSMFEWLKQTTHHFHHVPQISEAILTVSQTCRKRIALEPS